MDHYNNILIDLSSLFQKDEIQQIMILQKYQVLVIILLFSMDIPSQYSILHRMDSFSSYQTPRFYESAAVKYDKKPHTFRSRQTYVSDIQKLSRQIPGPDKYNPNPEQKKELIRYKAKGSLQKSQKTGRSLEKYTYLNDVQKKAKKIPQVGKYNLEVDKTEEIVSKYKKKGDLDRKNAPLFRPTTFDQVNVDTVRVAPGHYEVQKPLGYKSLLGSISREEKYKRSQSLPRLPGAADYNPIPATYETFSRKQSLASIKNPKRTDQVRKQTKKIQTLGPGPKYSLIVDWAVKKGKNGEVKGNNYLKNLHVPRQPGIYH